MTELVAEVEGQEPEEGDEEGKGAEGVPAYHEVDQLAAVVAEIDFYTSVVPAGAYVADPCHKVVSNRNFTGLTTAEATDATNYFHFREPVDKVAVRSSDGLIKPTEFLDRIGSVAENVWSIQLRETEDEVVLRSLQYPGYTFCHKVGTGQFGGVYVGDGQQNKDIAFML